MYRVITTVGTSLITNYRNIKEENIDGYVEINDDLLNRLDELTVQDVREEIDGVVTDIKEILNEFWIKGMSKDKDGKWYKTDENEYNEDCCAEIKTLLEFYKKEKEEINRDFGIELYLIATDTPSSVLVAELIKENISNFNKNIKVVDDVIIVKGMQTDDFQRFQDEGINNLFNEISQKIFKNNKKKKSDDVKTIINISGGYKAIIPYTTIFAQICDFESIYIYEDSDSLITIPPLPIQVDWIFAEEYYPYLDEPTIIKDKEKQDYLVEKGLLEKKDKDYSKTALGRFFKDVIDEALHVSRKNVMGFFFEYKMFEYYVNKSIRDEYKVVTLNEFIGDKEIDLILRKESGNNEDYIAVEVKSMELLRRTRIKELKKQIKEQKKAMDKFGYPKEYHLCLYTLNEYLFNNIQGKIEMIEELSRVFEDTQVKFRAFVIKADLNVDTKDGLLAKNQEDRNPYKRLMKDKLICGKNFKEINYKGGV